MGSVSQIFSGIRFRLVTGIYFRNELKLFVDACSDGLLVKYYFNYQENDPPGVGYRAVVRSISQNGCVNKENPSCLTRSFSGGIVVDGWTGEGSEEKSF